MVASSPAELLQTLAIPGTEDLHIASDVHVTLATGYTRVLASGSRWRPVGGLPQGTVYRPVGGVFSIEGRQVHEAYLVVDSRNALTGFYLPGEARYSSLDTSVLLPLKANP